MLVLGCSCRAGTAGARPCPTRGCSGAGWPSTAGSAPPSIAPGLHSRIAAACWPGTPRVKDNPGEPGFRAATWPQRTWGHKVSWESYSCSSPLALVATNPSPHAARATPSPWDGAFPTPTSSAPSGLRLGSRGFHSDPGFPELASAAGAAAGGGGCWAAPTGIKPGRPTSLFCWPSVCQKAGGVPTEGLEWALSSAQTDGFGSPWAPGAGCPRGVRSCSPSKSPEGTLSSCARLPNATLSALSV